MYIRPVLQTRRKLAELEIKRNTIFKSELFNGALGVLIFVNLVIFINTFQRILFDET